MTRKKVNTYPSDLRQRLLKAGKNISQEDLEKAIQEARMIKAVIFDYTGVFTREGEEMVEVVRQIKQQGYQVFILSNLFIEQEQQGQLSELIDKGYFAGLTGMVKPDEQAYRQILEENGLRPEECVYFDDLRSNVKAAARLGIRSYLFKGAEQTEKVLKKLQVL